MKNQQHNSLDLSSQTEARARLADRLGFLLAKRWIRIHRELEEKKTFFVDNSQQIEAIGQKRPKT